MTVFTDLTTQLDVNCSNHYFSSITDEFSTPQPLTSVPTVPTTTSLQSAHSSNISLLPFVQIHTTNAQPTNSNFGNIFRRQQNSEEIKSEESIKSEQNDATANALQQQQSNNTATECRSSTGHVTPTAASTTQSAPQITPTVRKCTQCPYLTLHAVSLEKHVSNTHGNRTGSQIQRNKITCPGCDNIFFAKESLEVHLQSDHLMSKEEVKQLLSHVSDEQPRKSRIYLKNVEFLREPAHQEQILGLDEHGYCYPAVQQNDGSNLMDLICESNNNLPEKLVSATESSPTKQKISIKSVDVLREPALMQRQGQTNFDFLPPSQNNQNSSMPLDNGEIMRYPSFLPQSDLPGLCTIPAISTRGSQPSEKPRRPKIYIKNVDILKEPIFLPPDNLTNVLNVSDDLHFNLFPVEEEFQGMPGKFIEEGVNNEYTFDCGNNFVDCTNFFLPEDTGFVQEEQASPRSKIYIKNVDILKQPPFQEQPRRSTNYLHLRTVDELNLMNKNEVENLIAPNLEQNLGTSSLITNSSENSKNSEETSVFGIINQDSSSLNKPAEFQTPPTISWTSDYVLDGLDSIIDSNSMGEQKNRHYELNTPQISIIDGVNDTAENHDPEILFVCAEELINANRDNVNGESEIAEMDQNSLEIVEILDDLERDQPSRESNLDPINLTPTDGGGNDFDEEALGEDPDQVLSAPEKGRIYVADNLLEAERDGCSREEASDTGDENKTKPRSRGRPFGSNRTGITRLRKLLGNTPLAETGTKCDVNGCAFRFKNPEKTDYHKRCHNTDGSHPMICPECQSTNFSNWNTLHTHLWRSHKVDMELHSCELCNFKTPIYSRLINTHSKIHSEERNYKCDQCEKAFKNSKQLKNHRRWHRTIAIAPPPDVHRCEECGSAFSHLKSLREHFCKGSDLFCCEICGKTLSSKSSLKLHMLTHESAKKFKCDSCDYMANDHNAFRRHRMTHDKSKMYICPLCDYKSIQSVAYQKHIRMKHPESADTIVHKCKFCPFATINEGLLTVHLAKHKLREEHNRAEGLKDKEKHIMLPVAMTTEESFNSDSDSIIISSSNSIVSTTSLTSVIAAIGTTQLDNNKTTESSTIETDPHQPRNKIKVKSDLVLTDPAKFSSNVVSPLLLPCFDSAIR